MTYRDLSPGLLAAANQSAKEAEYWLNQFPGHLEKSFFPYDHKSTLDFTGRAAPATQEGPNGPS